MYSDRTIELMLKWHKEHPGGMKPPAPPVIDPPTPQYIKMPHLRWVGISCFCCKRKGRISGLWHLVFTTGARIEFMCAECGLAEAWRRWSGGYMRKNLLSNKLLATVTYE